MAQAVDADDERPRFLSRKPGKIGKDFHDIPWAKVKRTTPASRIPEGPLSLIPLCTRESTQKRLAPSDPDSFAIVAKKYSGMESESSTCLGRDAISQTMN